MISSATSYPRLHLLQCPVTRLGHRELPVWLPAGKTGGNWLLGCATGCRRLIGSIGYNVRRLAKGTSGATGCLRLIENAETSLTLKVLMTNAQ
ncbi:hypothetical protein AVEN_15525-1 [Araneus ventricosus]|uniref:Uncharacterized protein n=1 Tax=Araneus ventricosus TaxID=182803 RepID=A0A4Y2NI92_ARAVE|nr:hypothetical protein AVEN_15525-1 [Araneus ventricosus]